MARARVSVALIYPSFLLFAALLDELGVERSAGNRVAHLAGGMVGNVADRVDRLARRPRRHEHLPPGEGGPRAQQPLDVRDDRLVRVVQARLVLCVRREKLRRAARAAGQRERRGDGGELQRQLSHRAQLHRHRPLRQQRHLHPNRPYR